jgi:quinolinate synthase
MNLPMLGATDAPLLLENIPALQDEVRALAAERDAVILAHNYQLPEIQDVAHYVGDSLGLSQRAARTESELIVFCGVHFMAETASVLCPEKRVLIPDLEAGCSLADSITAEQLRDWKARHPGAVVVMYVNTTAEVKAETDYCCTSANAVKVVEHI